MNMGWPASQGLVSYKTGQAVYNKYNCLAGLSIYNGIISLASQLTMG